MSKLLAISLILILSAFTIDQTLPDAAQEARAQTLFRELKCVVCQGQPLSESDAAIAQDMRKLIREKITAGATDAQIIAYLETRYGAEIATTPPLEIGTLLLWFGPFGLLFAGFLVFWRRK
jgi:cytochrome c-type biogenesis protein CcmH